MSSNYNQQNIDPKKFKWLIVGGAILLVLLFFGRKIFYTIDAGHAGLIYETFSGGIDSGQPPLQQGFHIIAPWNDLIDYEIRKQEISNTMTVLSSNLLDIQLDLTIFYSPIESDLANLELRWSRDYAKKMIIPTMRSVTREVIANYLPEEINTTKRELIQQQIDDEMREKLKNNYVNLGDVLIRNIELPLKLRESIERKLQQEQESLEYEFRLTKESKEAERKRIEAEGIQAFQTIVTKSITPALLRWKGIEATETLSKSENAKIVIIGSGEDGLPLILGGN